MAERVGIDTVGCRSNKATTRGRALNSAAKASRASGWWMMSPTDWKVKRCDDGLLRMVKEGMKIGFVTDYFGKLILEARAPVSGVILHINAVPSLKKGDNVADIAAVAAHAP